MDIFWAAPPVSRTLTALTLLLSVPLYVGFLPFHWIVFYLEPFMRFPPQIWRLATCFLITGPQLSMIFDPYFLYTYGSRLELGSPRFTKPGDFFAYTVFVCVTILGLSLAFTGGMVFTSALIMAFTYTACQDERGSKSVFIVITIPTQLVPFAMLLMTLVMVGPGEAMIQANGLVAAHLYDFLTRLYPEFGGGSNFLVTPAFVTRWFSSETATVTVKSYGTSITPAGRQPTSASTGASTGVLPESWKSRGSGHRLGGD